MVYFFFYLRVIMPGTKKKKKYLNIDIKFKIEFFKMHPLRWKLKVRFKIDEKV